MFARFDGFQRENPTFNLIRVSCVDNDGYAHEFSEERQPFLGNVLPVAPKSAIDLGNEKGKKTIESGTDVKIRLQRDL